MRVLVWQWGRFGTGPRYALELAQALRAHCGHDVMLSLAEGSELLRDSVLRSAVDFPIRTYANMPEFVRRSLGIRRVLGPMLEKLRAAPPDAAIVTMMGYWDVFLVRELGRMGVPVAVIVHDAEVHPGDRFHLVVQLQRYMARSSRAVVTLTDFVASQIKRRIPLTDKSHATIPLAAFDFADLNLAPPKVPEPSPGRPLRLLMAGRLKRYKGLELLADALKRLEGLPVVLRVAGAPQDPGEIAALAALPGVELDLGWKDDRAFLALIDWADVCVLPYVEASQSGVVPMSFTRGRPVVATPVGGLPEQVRHEETGLLTGEVSAEALAASIRRLIEDRQLVHRLGKNARRHAETEIGWPAIAPRFAAVLEAAAGDGR